MLMSSVMSLVVLIDQVIVKMSVVIKFVVVGRNIVKESSMNL